MTTSIPPLLLAIAFVMGATSTALSAAIPAQGEMEVIVGKEVYSLPAVGESGGSEAPSPPIHQDTLLAIEDWRSFAWDSKKKEYRYHFAVAPKSSAVLLLIPDGSAKVVAGLLDDAAQLVAEYIGAEELHHDYVSVICRSQEEFDRAAAFAAGIALEDPALSSSHDYVRDVWLPNAQSSPTFFLPLTGVVGCIEGHSEKWSPEHEAVRGFAQVALIRRAEHLSHVNPIVIGLSWNIEFDVLGDILSIPSLEGFQYDIGRGKWSSSKISSILKRLSKEVKSEHDRPLELSDLPYLGHGAGLPEDASALSWSVARHLVRHHVDELGAVITALSTRVEDMSTTVHADGSTEYWLDPRFQLQWNAIEAVLRAEIEGFDFEELRDCISKKCKTCKSYGKDRGINS